MNIEFIKAIIIDLQWRFSLGQYPKIKNIIVEPGDSLFVEYESGQMFRWYRNVWGEIE